MKPAGMLLAGGRSLRMGGGDKPLLRLGDRTLLDHAAGRLRPQVAELALNANGDPARFAAAGLEVVPDPVPGLPGPLAGILAGLLWAARRGHEALVTVPADTPFIPDDLAAGLAASGAGCAWAAYRGRLHPAVGWWPVGLAGSLRTAIAAGRLRVRDWGEEQGAATIAWDALPYDPFTNINRPEELDAARALLGRLSPSG